MLRTTTLRFPLRTIVPCARRGFAYSVCLRNPSSTSSFPTAAAAQAQTQAHEKKDESALTTPDGISTVPQKASKVQGDWVLFHPVYTPSELRAVKTIHQKPKTFSDKIAYGLVRFSRKMFDVVSRYTAPEGEPKPGMTLEELRKKGFSMTEGQWLTRILFLESIAGVPGMVAATVRHLQSLRLMRRDNGWIHTCLEEAENERMHLMTFITVKKPSIWIRGLILGAQGVYYNLFFLSYLFAPRVCHRFVGYLEEEAVHTYTRAIADVEAGLFPEWHNRPAPEIAIDYWRLPSTATMLDVLYAVRSDETSHRFVNHSLANLNPATDVNPFALREPGMDVKGGKISFERDESEEFVVRSHEIVRKELEKMK